MKVYEDTVKVALRFMIFIISWGRDSGDGSMGMGAWGQERGDGSMGMGAIFFYASIFK